MKELRWQIFFGAFLVALSVIFYLIHYAIFRDAHHIFIYLLGDIAFVFFEVLLVTLIIHQLLTFREKRALLEKMNMVIGTFFSEVGKNLIKLISAFDNNINFIRRDLFVTNNWTENDFLAMKQRLIKYEPDVRIENGGSLEPFKVFLTQKREFLLRLLENQNLLEHDSFTELLRTVFHLTEELESRQSLLNIPKPDLEHIVNDTRRVYRSLMTEWLSYMKHLNEQYPYLFSFSIRTNPFDPDATPEIKA